MQAMLFTVLDTRTSTPAMCVDSEKWCPLNSEFCDAIQNHGSERHQGTIATSFDMRASHRGDSRRAAPSYRISYAQRLTVLGCVV